MTRPRSMARRSASGSATSPCPRCGPFFVIVLVLLSLDLARAYDIVRIMTDGGPAHRTELIWTYAGELAIRGSQFGLASAMSMAGVVLGVAFTFYLFRQMMQLRADMR